jgi:tetratricopeptide (TPR) repeat protein
VNSLSSSTFQLPSFVSQSAYKDQKRYEEAIVSYERAIALNPEYATAYNNLGITYKDQKRYEEAIVSYERAIALDSNLKQAFANRGESYRLVKRYEEALKDFDRAIELDNEYIWAINQRFFLYLLTNQLQKALQESNRILEIAPENDMAYGCRALAYLKLNQPESAAPDFQKALIAAQAIYGKDPSDYQNTFNLALYHLAAGHHEESDRLYTSNLTAPIEWLQMAIDDLDDFLQLFPDSAIGQQTKQRLQGAINSAQPTTL